MRRLFWLGTGLGAGATGAVFLSRWMRRQTEKLAPSNLGRQAAKAAGGAVGRLSDALGEYRTGAAEREAEIAAMLAAVTDAQDSAVATGH